MTQLSLEVAPLLDRSRGHRSTYSERVAGTSALEIISLREAREGRALLGEHFPVLLCEEAKLRRDDEAKIMHAWYALYATILYLDDLTDAPEGPVLPSQILRSAALVHNAHALLFEASGHLRNYPAILEDLSRSLVGQAKDVAIRQVDGKSRRSSDREKNRSLVAITRVIEGHAVDRADLVAVVEPLLSIIQALDDFGDMGADLQEGNLTALLKMLGAKREGSATYETLVTAGLLDQRFSRFLASLDRPLAKVCRVVSDRSVSALAKYLGALRTDLGTARVALADLEKDFRLGRIDTNKALERFDRVVPLVAQST